MGKPTRLKLHRWRTLAFALLFCAEPALGTVVSVIVIPQAIVMAADGKTTQYLSNERVPTIGRVSRKLRIMHNGTVIGSYGMSKIGVDPHPAYYLGSFYDSLEKEIGAKRTVRETAQITGEKATLAMSGFNQVLASGTVTRDIFIKQNGRDNPLAGFLVAGYESGHPIVFHVEVEINWIIGRLRGPVVTLVYPSPISQNSLFSSDADTIRPRFFAWSECRIRKINNVPVVQAEAQVRAVVDYGIEIRKDTVGLPITLVTLFPNGRHRVKRYSSRLPDLCINRSNKSK